MPAGIDAGIDGMLSILTGDAEEWQRRARSSEDDDTLRCRSSLLHIVVMIIVIVLILRSMRRTGAQRHRTRSGRWIIDRLGTGRRAGAAEAGLRRRGRRVFGRRRLVRRRRRFGELVGMISAEEQEAWRSAIREVESDTDGEIVLVVARPGRRLPAHSAAMGAVGGLLRPMAADLAHRSSVPPRSFCRRLSLHSR